MKLDLADEYLLKRSLRLDLLILVKTFLAIFDCVLPYNVHHKQSS